MNMRDFLLAAFPPKSYLPAVTYRGRQWTVKHTDPGHLCVYGFGGMIFVGYVRVMPKTFTDTRDTRPGTRNRFRVKVLDAVRDMLRSVLSA